MAWLLEVMAHVEGQPISAVCFDRYKISEMSEGLDAAGIRAPVQLRGFGYKDGSDDIQRFRRAVLDGMVKVRPSLLLRSAMADTVLLQDPAQNLKLAKARSLGRIDAVASAVIAIGEGARQMARPARVIRPPVWA
ncbi:terminase TerL endonuclease subunit [Methyloceanibacter marginalis]|uniref:terminase TerL endonuclease subunit n=1 Tax=Methyloceanibacter marginalis TaxID=1774971 RepID=UPI00195932EB|nr:terminase TerL endonuclease subunit [Methyloceanibacter marginalis]